MNLVLIFLCDIYGMNEPREGETFSQHNATLFIQNMKHTNIQTERQIFVALGNLSNSYQIYCQPRNHSGGPQCLQNTKMCKDDIFCVNLFSASTIHSNTK